MTSIPEFLKDEYPFESRYLEMDGNRLHYIDEGPRCEHAIVMLHGNPTWSFYYRNLVKAFSDRYRIIVPDHIGCGLSDKPESYDYTLATRIHDLEVLLESLSLKSVTLVLHDWGGAIGMGYAVRHAEKVKAIVAANTAAFLGGRIPLRIGVCRIPLFGSFAVRGLNGFAGVATRMATAQKGGLPKRIAQGMILPYDNWKNRRAVLEFVHDIPLSPKDRSFAVVQEIESKLHLFKELPVKIFWGLQDFCFTTQSLDRWLEFFPCAAVHRYADAGHYVFEDAIDDVTKELGPFFDAIAALQGEPGSVA